jgi:hypothetical protein
MSIFQLVFGGSSISKTMLQNTKYTRSKGHIELDWFPEELADMNGITPLKVMADLTIGEEVALYWLDRTPFIHRLGSKRPFQLFLRSGLFNSSSGPLMWMLFYVPNAPGSPQPLGSVECHLNPFSAQQVDLWDRLANQTHWHLTLLGPRNEVFGFFEFENIYGLGKNLDVMGNACKNMRAGDFMRAKQEFWDEYTMADLYAMK